MYSYCRGGIGRTCDKGHDVWRRNHGSILPLWRLIYAFLTQFQKLAFALPPTSSHHKHTKPEYQGIQLCYSHHIGSSLGIELRSIGMASSQNHFLGRHYDAEHSTGPFQSLNPTKRFFVAKKGSSRPSDEERNEYSPASSSDSLPNVTYVWRSRDNRKGRHALVVDRDPRKHNTTGPKPSNTWERTLRGILKMAVRYPIWDISYDVAVVFTIGECCLRYLATGSS